MKIIITAIGKQLKPWMEDGIESYLKRLPKNFQIKVNTIAPYKSSQKNQPALCKEKEADKLLQHIKNNEYIIAMDETSKEFTTSQWHQNIEQLAVNQPLHFLFGGAYGLDQAVKQRANAIWSLGKITMPHGLARLVLIEQLYRINCLMNNHPYHKI